MRQGAIFTVAVFLIITFIPMWVIAGQPLIVSFGSHNAEPYAFIEDGQLAGGIIKDIADEVGKKLGMEIRYKYIPRKRMKSYLLTGKSHVRLIANPHWVEDPTQYQWSVPLFQESDRFVVSAKHTFPVIKIDDLKGKRLGTILGYHYPELMDRFEAQDIIRDDATTLEANFKKLEANRIDCLIDSNILIAYYLKKHLVHKEYIVAEKVASTHDIQAMFSQKLPVSIERINDVFQQLKDSGKMQQILDRYK